ncbi:MAG: UDP-glucose 4-epimerase [Actinomycetota bacterium]|jgi:UDP-glucose 4-epimerase|nr:UDP-glucose 4-epimerase [Actinomycetota bacterium]
MAAQGKRRVLITGVSRFLGLRIAKRLENDPSIEALIGVDLEEPPVPVKNLEFIRVDIGNPLIARVLQASDVDTLIHTNISSSQAILGGRSQMKENNVIGTMQVLAAAQRADAIKKVIVKSSTAIYGSSPSDPSILREDHGTGSDLSGYGKDVAEAEITARDFGRRRKDVDLVILRTQNVIGPTVNTSMTDYLSLPVLPTALGYDPRLQFLHEEDAVDAFVRAMGADCRGIFNIAADGIVFLSQATRLLGRLPAPVLLPAAEALANLMRRFDIVDFPTDQLKLIVYGRVVDTQRAKDAFGFAPQFSTFDSLVDFRDNRAGELAPGPVERPPWERELFEYLKKAQTQKETV